MLAIYTSLGILIGGMILLIMHAQNFRRGTYVLVFIVNCFIETTAATLETTVNQIRSKDRLFARKKMVEQFKEGDSFIRSKPIYIDKSQVLWTLLAARDHV